MPTRTTSSGGCRSCASLDTLGRPLTVSVQLPGRDLFAAVWLAQVGRVPVLLLDTDVPDNDDSDRPITHILYVRGREMRLHQELVLGVGGVRALRELGLDPAVWHLNEGHSALLLAERARELVAQGVALDDAWPAVRRNSVFSIHTPVAAGNERFDAELVRRVAGPLFGGDGRPGTGGIPIDRLLALGLGVEADPGQFDMTAFSLRLTHGANAVSHLHGQVSNAIWHDVAPTRDPGHHERRPHSDVDRPADARPARAPHGREPGGHGRRAAREPLLGADLDRSRPPSCGTRTSARSWSSRSSPAAGCATSSRATARLRAPSRSWRRSWTRAC